MASYVVQRIQTQLNSHGKALQGARVLVYGAAFKPNVSDMRNSRAVRVMELLQQSGAEIRYHDPRVPTFKLAGKWIKSIDLQEAELSASDIVTILVGHNELDAKLLITKAPLLFDAVNATVAAAGPHVERL